MNEEGACMWEYILIHACPQLYELSVALKNDPDDFEVYTELREHMDVRIHTHTHVFPQARLRFWQAEVS